MLKRRIPQEYGPELRPVLCPLCHSNRYIVLRYFNNRRSPGQLQARFRCSHPFVCFELEFTLKSRGRPPVIAKKHRLPKYDLPSISCLDLSPLRRPRSHRGPRKCSPEKITALVGATLPLEAEIPFQSTSGSLQPSICAGSPNRSLRSLSLQSDDAAKLSTLWVSINRRQRSCRAQRTTRVVQSSATGESASTVAEAGAKPTTCTALPCAHTSRRNSSRRAQRTRVQSRASGKVCNGSGSAESNPPYGTAEYDEGELEQIADELSAGLQHLSLEDFLFQELAETKDFAGADEFYYSLPLSNECIGECLGPDLYVVTCLDF